ncbi:HTH-type transcriptional activator RhaS [Sphingobium sp. S6]|nr:HTH-type transcriptional activator RhaS [Sphingobium sp. S6]CAD7340260.1 HTH-type transcriptional activator RhaS [Sphingobium sp. S8]
MAVKERDGFSGMRKALAIYSKVDSISAMRSAAVPPYYFIYGQHIRDLDPRFIHVERISDRGTLHHGNVEPHVHPHLHQLSYWLQGEGRFTADGAEHDLAPGTLTWMPASVVHGFTVDAAADAIVLSLSHDFLSNVLAHVDAAPVETLARTPLVAKIPVELVDRVRETFLDLEREHQFPSWALKHVVSAHVQIVMIMLARLFEADRLAQGSPPKAAALFSSFLSLLDRRFRECRTVDAYVALLGTTPYLLNRACREGAGRNASEVIRGRILLEAKRLLHYTALSSGDVAFALGFSDPAHFGRAFRAETGLSPARWRAQQRALAEVDRN